MFDMIKPQLMFMLAGAAKAMEARASQLEDQAAGLVAGQHTESRIVIYTRAGLWRDAAAMINKSIAQ